MTDDSLTMVLVLGAVVLGREGKSERETRIQVNRFLLTNKMLMKMGFREGQHTTWNVEH